MKGWGSSGQGYPFWRVGVERECAHEYWLDIGSTEA